MTGMGYDNDTVRERLSAAGVGLYDFAVDSINKLSNWMTGSDTSIPNVPEYEDQAAQFFREVSAVITPGILLGGATKAGGTAIAGSSTTFYSITTISSSLK